MNASKLPSKLLADPFFLKAGNTDWNACVGAQGREEHFLFGFMEAAQLMVTDIIENKRYRERDTVVLPILFCARHGAELALKHCVGNLVKIGILPTVCLKNHNLEALLTSLSSVRIGDRVFERTLEELSPFFQALSSVDPDGQSFRYEKSLDGKKHLSEKSIINLEVVRISIAEMKRLITDLVHRLADLEHERTTGAYTQECSRNDLLEIASALPPKDRWNTQDFVEAKSKIRSEFNLSSNKLSNAINLIKDNRAMRARIGLDTSLLALSEESAMLVLRSELERRKRDKNSNTTSDWIGKEEMISIIDEIPAQLDFYREHFQLVKKNLTVEELADVETIFYIGRNKEFPENYTRNYQAALKTYKRAKEPVLVAGHVLSKANFCEEFVNGIGALGALKIEAKLRQLVAPE